jgi:hypothetical protein
VLSGVTSQGYLNAAVITGAGYTGSTDPLGPGESLLVLAAWLSVGALAGSLARTDGGLVGLWLGALAGSVVGIAGDPSGNILWLDLLVAIFGVGFFLTPGFVLGAAIAARRDRLEPDGSGRRPTPPPLWTRGAPRMLSRSHWTLPPGVRPARPRPGRRTCRPSPMPDPGLPGPTEPEGPRLAASRL